MIHYKDHACTGGNEVSIHGFDTAEKDLQGDAENAKDEAICYRPAAIAEEG